MKAAGRDGETESRSRAAGGEWTVVVVFFHSRHPGAELLGDGPMVDSRAVAGAEQHRGGQSVRSRLGCRVV